MLRRVKMLGGVLILGGVAAADVSAGQTEPQVDPGVAHFQTLLAAVGMRLDIVDLVEMSALGHILSVP
jgi:hypothetical protein